MLATTLVASGGCSSSGNGGDGGKKPGDLPTASQTVGVILVLERPGDLEQDLLTLYAHPTKATFLSFSDTVEKYGMSPANQADLETYLKDNVFSASGWQAANYYQDPTGTFVLVEMDEATITKTFPDAKTGDTWNYAPKVPTGLAEWVEAVTANFSGFSPFSAEPFGPPPPPKGGLSTDCSSYAVWADFPWQEASGTRAFYPGPTNTCPATVKVGTAELQTACYAAAPHPGKDDAEEARSLLPEQLRTAHGVPEALRGAGRRATIVLPVHFDPDYLDAFASVINSPFKSSVNLQQLAIRGYDAPIEDEGEIMIDVSMVLGMAPDLDLLTVIAGPFAGFPSSQGAAVTVAIDDAAAFAEAINEANYPVNKNGVRQLPDVISYSAGINEDFLKGPGFSIADGAVETIFQMAAMMGVTITVAVGDSGSFGPNGETGGYPATSPWITAVGGTNIELDDDNGIVSVGVWNGNLLGEFTSCASSGYATGGGNSVIFDQPPWQKTAKVPGTKRASPDLASMADGINGVFMVTSDSSPANGTSMASPLTAGLFMLFKEHLASDSSPQIGLATPLLYAMGALAAEAGTPPQAFHDIKEKYLPSVEKGQYNLNNNQSASGEIICCEAVEGYDRASGWGFLNLPEAFKAWTELNAARPE